MSGPSSSGGNTRSVGIIVGGNCEPPNPIAFRTRSHTGIYALGEVYAGADTSPYVTASDVLRLMRMFKTFTLPGRRHLAWRCDMPVIR
jgi:hypothetical protein